MTNIKPDWNGSSRSKNKKNLVGKITHLNRKISKYKKNINMLETHNYKLQTKLNKIPNIVKFIFGIKNR